MLHVTNGDSAVGALRAAGFSGDFLPWRDVLHDGPVPAGLSPGELAAVRAVYIAGCGWADVARTLRTFRERDRTLGIPASREEVVLWFEHDLYDQLQLIQVLDRFAASTDRPERLAMTVEADYIGTMTAGRLRQIHDGRRAVTDAEIGAAARAWAAFRAPDPTALAALAEADLAPLPFLHAAVGRLLEEYPAPGSGLSRTEEQILRAIADGAATPALVFRASQAREAAVFMGDASFWQCVHSLLLGPRPLVRWTGGAAPVFPPPSFEDRRFLDHGLEITADGRASLEGRLDHVAINPRTRWIGGVRQGPGRVWRYDRIGRGLSVNELPQR